MKAKRKRRMSRRRRERTYIAVMVLLAIAVSIGLTRSVMRDDKEFEEYEQQSQEFNARMQRIDEKREASGQNAMLEQVRTWQQEQDTEPDKYAVFDTMSADWGGEEDGFVLYEIPKEYSRTGGYFPEKMQVYTYCVCKQYGVRYDLVIALIEKESGYRFDKVGDDGHSIGYMQIYEECHRDRMERLNVTDLTNPYQNVLVGIDYLSELIERYGTIQDALAAYNYGEQGAKQHLYMTGNSLSKTITKTRYTAEFKFTGYWFSDEVSLNWQGAYEAIFEAQGNRATPCRLTITATEYIEQLRINGLSCGEIIIDTIPRGATVIIDGETGFATMDGENKFKDVSLMEFPYLTTGQEKEHHLIFSDNNALVTLQYKPMWL